jgi:phosphohistidine phosphatase
MLQLYLLRHGVAVPHGTPGIPDDERPLTPEGESKMEDVARGIRRLRLGLDRIVTSPLPRARRTAEIVAEELDMEDRLEDSDVLRAGASASTIRDWLGTRTEKRLMIVGHNPALTELLGLLIGVTTSPLPFELKKGGLAALESKEGGGFLLDWLVTPKVIRRLLD